MDFCLTKAMGIDTVGRFIRRVVSSSKSFKEARIEKSFLFLPRLYMTGSLRFIPFLIFVLGLKHTCPYPVICVLILRL